MAATRWYGPRGQHVPDIRVSEQAGYTQLPDPFFGTCAVVGVTQRGPMGEYVPIYDMRQYQELYGDPNDPTWHLYADGKHLTPDWMNHYWRNSNGAGPVWMHRLTLPGARKASLILYARMGAPVLQIDAASEGRWGGAANRIEQTPVVVATARSFTLVAPGVQANEFVGAEASFTGVSGKTYKIIANEAAAPGGEVIFTVGAQHNLALEGVAGPVALAGTAEYSTHADLSGTIECPLYTDLSGTVNVNKTVLTGVGTAFLSELEVGRNIYYGGEARAIISITSDTTLTVASAFSIDGTGETLQRDNLTVTGTTTAFTTELIVGDILYVTIGTELQGRTIASIASDSELQLTSGFTNEITAGTIAQRDSLTVVGTGTAFLSEAAVGHYLVDPNRLGSTVKITAVVSDTELKVEMPFAQDFSAAQLTKQSQLGSVVLDPGRTEGLSVRVVPGERFPKTHFSLAVYFRGQQVMSVPDCSLDASDPRFVEDEVKQANRAYQRDEREYHRWITATTLWTSDYTTHPDSDVRPTNGAGKILALESNRLYTVAPLEYDYLVGESVYPNPYQYTRTHHRIEAAESFVDLDGTVSSAGVNVTGTATTFASDLKVGDYLYDPNTDTARQIRSVLSDTALVLRTVFPSDIPALTSTKRAGWIEVNEAYDLPKETAAGNYFWTVYPQPLQKGYSGDDDRVLPSDYIQIANPDLDLLERAVYGKNMGLVRMFCPGISDIAVQKAFSHLAEQRAFEFRVELPSWITSAAVAESWVLDQVGRSDFISVFFPSYGWEANPLGSGYRLVPLSGLLAGGESNNARANGGYHFPYAGIKATLPGILRLPVSPSPADQEILTVAGIIPIVKRDGNFVVWGIKVPSIAPIYDDLHVRRIQSHYIRVFKEARNLLEMIFLPNQPGVADKILLILDQFATNEYRKGVITNWLPFDQAVEIDTAISDQATLTAEDTRSTLIRILEGHLDIYFFYVPTGVLEFLNIHVGPQRLADRYGQFSAAS